MTCLVTYDIKNNRIRSRLARYLKKEGVRLQKSVFAVKVERHAYKKMLREISKITGKEEHVAVFRLCNGCMKNAIQIGAGAGILHIY